VRRGLLWYFVLGTAFGFVLTRAEVISWFRIQEMFRFQSFHMFGILGSAVLVAGVSLRLLGRPKVSALCGDLDDGTLGPVPVEHVRFWAGGAVFGLGWALTGACPGPLFALVGAGVPVMVVAIGTALAGTWFYGFVRPRLPH
jgi:uncharacterized membrane protein YedE/YeeE